MFIDLLLLTYEYVPFNSFLLIYFHTSFFHNAILCSQRIPPGTLFLFYCSFTPIVPPLALRGFSLHNYRTNPLFHRYRPLHTLLQLLNIANFIQFCYLILKKRIIFLSLCLPFSLSASFSLSVPPFISLCFRSEERRVGKEC